MGAMELLEHTVKPNGFDFNKCSLKQISTKRLCHISMAKTMDRKRKY